MSVCVVAKPAPQTAGLPEIPVPPVPVVVVHPAEEIEVMPDPMEKRLKGAVAVLPASCGACSVFRCD